MTESRQHDGIGRLASIAPVGMRSRASHFSSVHFAVQWRQESSESKFEGIMTVEWPQLGRMEGELQRWHMLDPEKPALVCAKTVEI
jgi:hypothetical protein